VVGRVVDSFRRNGSEMVRTLRAALDADQCAAVQFTAHTLKGLSGTVGARRVQALCEALERAGRAGSLSETGAIFADLQRELALAISALPDDAAQAGGESPAPSQVSASR
jgi:HPt (histidine-containing phosphotransfer) domain-containing protein